MMELVASQITWQSIIYKRNKRLSQLVNDRRKPLNQAVFAPLPTGNRARTAYLHCIKDGTNIDPTCKTGVFLREIAKRLMTGLSLRIPDEEERRKHIFTKQLFGIAITEMTSLLSRRSLYCSKFANTFYSIAPFETIDGNIRFKNTDHHWDGNRCGFCGASKAQYDREEHLEQHAYEFIHTTKLEDLFEMRFDVIIGNPPYQLEDSGFGKSAKPIYQHFVAQSKKLSPRFLMMIIPSRWYSGGKRLDDFRKEMLTDKQMRALVDYENFKDVFPGVDLAGGACYFLWEKGSNGKCSVTNIKDGKAKTISRHLDEYEVFIPKTMP